MNIFLDSVLQHIEVFILILVRVTSLFVISPIFGNKSIPVMLKIGFGCMIALIITPIIGTNNTEIYNGLLQYVLLILQEFVIGLMLGFVCYMAFMSLYVAGQIIDTQIGFGIISVIDPESNIEIPVIANLYNIIALLMLFSINGHHMIISSVFYSYKVLPIGAFSFQTALLDNIIRMFIEMFVIGFKIAAPILVIILITNVALGILARTIPQMNIFIVGMPLKIAVGFVIIILVLPMFPIIMDNISNGMFRDISVILKDMMKR